MKTILKNTPVLGNDNKYHYLYKITNNINNKFYYGVHSCVDLNKDSYCGSGKILKKAFNTYGINNFTKEIIEFFDNEESMFKKEFLVVTDEVVENRMSYNVSTGGKGGRNNIVVVINENGEHITTTREEARKNKYESVNKGENNPMFGRHHKPESIKLLSEKIKKYYKLNKRVVSVETKIKKNKKLRNRFTIIYGNHCKRVFFDDVEKYLNEGWKVCGKKFYINNGVDNNIVNRYEYKKYFPEWEKGKLKTKKEKIQREKGKLYEYNGGMYTVKEISKKSGLCTDTIRKRLRLYNSIEDIPQNQHVLKGKKYNYNGELLTISQISKKYNVSRELIKSRIKLKWDIKSAVETPCKMRRKHSSKLYLYENEYYSITELSEKLSLPYSTIYQRITKGEYIVDKPKFVPRTYNYNGEYLTISQISEKYNISLSTVKQRLKNGWTVEETIETPIMKKNIS